jgi:hypothetical protein
MLRAITSKITLAEEVLVQIEAITVGHPRAIERAGEFISSNVKASTAPKRWGEARDLYTSIVYHLSKGTAAAALASCPGSELLEAIISRPPTEYFKLRVNASEKIPSSG